MVELKEITKCAREHCSILKAAQSNHKFVILRCDGCDKRNECITIKRMLEEQANK